MATMLQGWKKLQERAPRTTVSLVPRGGRKEEDSAQTSGLMASPALVFPTWPAISNAQCLLMGHWPVFGVWTMHVGDPMTVEKTLAPAFEAAV